MSAETIFTVEFDGAVTLGLSEIWPDRDAPENPTAADVAARLEKEGSVHQLIREWNLPVEVSVDGQRVRRLR